MGIWEVGKLDVSFVFSPPFIESVIWIAFAHIPACSQLVDLQIASLRTLQSHSRDLQVGAVGAVVISELWSFLLPPGS